MRREIIVCDRCGIEVTSAVPVSITYTSSNLIFATKEDFCNGCSTEVARLIKAALATAGVNDESGELRQVGARRTQTRQKSVVNESPSILRIVKEEQSETINDTAVHEVVPHQTQQHAERIIAYLDSDNVVFTGDPGPDVVPLRTWSHPSFIWDVIADLGALKVPQSEIAKLKLIAGDPYTYANATGMFIEEKNGKAKIECKGRKGVGETVEDALVKLAIALGVPNKKASFSIARRF